MKHKSRFLKQRKHPKTRLRLPDLCPIARSQESGGEPGRLRLDDSRRKERAGHNTGPAALHNPVRALCC